MWVLGVIVEGFRHKSLGSRALGLEVGKPPLYKYVMSYIVS